MYGGFASLTTEASEPCALYFFSFRSGRHSYLNRTDYVRFRDFLLYGKEGLGGKQASISLLQGTLTPESADEPTYRYSVEWS